MAASEGRQNHETVMPGIVVLTERDRAHGAGHTTGRLSARAGPSVSFVPSRTHVHALLVGACNAWPKVYFDVTVDGEKTDRIVMGLHWSYHRTRTAHHETQQTHNHSYGHSQKKPPPRPRPPTATATTAATPVRRTTDTTTRGIGCGLSSAQDLLRVWCNVCSNFGALFPGFGTRFYSKSYT